MHGPRSLPAALIAALLVLSFASGQRRVSGPARHRDRAVRARRSGRHHRAHPFDLHAADAGAKPHHRESRRRGRQHRHGTGRTRQARRLHAADDFDGDLGEHRAVQEPALRSDQGLRADLRTRERAERACGASRLRHRDNRRSRRARESAAQHVQLRQSGRGHQVASHRRAVEAARRHRHGARAVSRRRSCGAGRAGGPVPSRLRCARRRRAADQVRRSPRARRHRRDSAGSRCRMCRP